VAPSGHEQIMTLRGERRPGPELEQGVDALARAAHAQDAAELRRLLMQLVPEYDPADN